MTKLQRHLKKLELVLTDPLVERTTSELIRRAFDRCADYQASAEGLAYSSGDQTTRFVPRIWKTKLLPSAPSRFPSVAPGTMRQELTVGLRTV
jgi:hypothetical protein